MSRTIEIDAEVTIRITIDDERVITAMLADEDGRNSACYHLADEEEILRHLAFNALLNGRHDLRHLDGWGDMPEGASMQVDRDSVQFFTPRQVAS